MLLRTFILRHGEEQLSPAWAGFGDSDSPPAPADLREPVLALLDMVAAAMRRGTGRLRPQAGAAGSFPAVQLGLEAYAAGLSAAALLDGLRALRGGLARRWLRDDPPAAPANAELLDFYDAFDAAAAAALSAFLGAQERDRALALGVVAHELRGKLQSVLMSNYLMERVQDAALGRELLGQQKKTLERLGRLAGELTALGLRSGLECRLEQAELNDLAAQTLQDVAMEFPGRRFVLRSCGSLPGRWDRARICQVLLNLLRYTVQHGPAQAAVVSTLSRAGGCARLTIHSDTTALPRSGGVPLDPLCSANANASANANGDGDGDGEAPPPRGLGLFIAREIVRRHHGRLSVSAGAGDGTCFSLLLPLDCD